MIKILFICHGNICRSVAAEMVLKQMIRERRISGIEADSAATTREEIGNDIYPPMKRALQESGYRCEPHSARQTVRADYERYDYLIAMDEENLYYMNRCWGPDPERKIKSLLEFAGKSRDIADPWYTGNFDQTYDDVLEGCTAFLEYLNNK